jgi:hypothetical protein
MAISLKANSAPLKLNFGDSGAQGIFFGPSFGAQGQIQNVGLTFNLTAGTSTPSCTSSTTTSSTSDSTTTSKSTSTSKTTATTTSGTNPTSSPVVYCHCQGTVEYEGNLVKRDLDDDLDDLDDDLDDDDDDAKDLELRRRSSHFRSLRKNPRHDSNLFKRSSVKYKIKFKTKCGKFTCKCERKKVSVDYISLKDLNFDRFGTC